MVFCTGDAVVLERWTEARTKLHLHIIKGKAQDLPAMSSSITKVKSKRAARPAQRAKHAKPANGSAAKQPSGQGCSPPRGTSGALEALHDAALLCATTLNSNMMTSLGHQGGLEGSAPALNEHSEGHGVSAAVVAAADAAALHLNGSKLTQAAGLMPNYRMLSQSRGFSPSW